MNLRGSGGSMEEWCKYSSHAWNYQKVYFKSKSLKSWNFMPNMQKQKKFFKENILLETIPSYVFLKQELMWSLMAFSSRCSFKLFDLLASTLKVLDS